MIARTPEEFTKQGIEVRLNTPVDQIDTRKGHVVLRSGERIPYDMLTVATGASASVLPIPGLDLDGVFTLKNLTDAIRIKNYIENNNVKKAIILGAGFVAMEMSEAFRKRGIHTEVVYRGELPVKKWDPVFSRRILEELQRNNVSFLTGRNPVAIEQGSGGLLYLLTDKETFDADIIILALGVKPETAMAEKAGVKLGKSGAIKVDFSQRTSRDEIYAAGDCAEVFHMVSREWVYFPLGDIANKQGRTAGRNIGGNPMSFSGVVGAQGFKVFDLEVAATGLDEREAKRKGFYPVSAVIKGNYMARSMDAAATLDLKLIADKSTARLLGAQAVGCAGVVGRINTLSACLWNEMDLDQIGYLDLAYSPPFGGAWDVIQTAAQILKRKL